MSSQAFTTRICQTGEDTDTVLGSIPAILPGSLLSPFPVSTAPPPFGEAARMPVTPPSVGRLVGADDGYFDEDTAKVIGICDDSTAMPEEPDGSCVGFAWDIDNQDPSEGGVILLLMSRILYKTVPDGGSEILYGYCRSLGFSTTGRLSAISDECARVIIDTPEEC